MAESTYQDEEYFKSQYFKRYSEYDNVDIKKQYSQEEYFKKFPEYKYVDYSSEDDNEMKNDCIHIFFSVYSILYHAEVSNPNIPIDKIWGGEDRIRKINDFIHSLSLNHYVYILCDHDDHFQTLVNRMDTFDNVYIKILKPSQTILEYIKVFKYKLNIQNQFQILLVSQFNSVNANDDFVIIHLQKKSYIKALTICEMDYIKNKLKKPLSVTLYQPKLPLNQQKLYEINKNLLYKIITYVLQNKTYPSGDLFEDEMINNDFRKFSLDLAMIVNASFKKELWTTAQKLESIINNSFDYSYLYDDSSNQLPCPPSIELYARFGKILGSLLHYQESEFILNKCIQFKPDKYEYKLELGWLKIKLQNKPAEAEPYFQKLREKMTTTNNIADKNKKSIIFGTARYCHELKRFFSAEAYYLLAIEYHYKYKHYGFPFTIYLFYIRLLVETQQFKYAKRLYKQFIEKYIGKIRNIAIIQRYNHILNHCDEVTDFVPDAHKIASFNDFLIKNNFSAECIKELNSIGIYEYDALKKLKAETEYPYDNLFQKNLVAHIFDFCNYHNKI